MPEPAVRTPTFSPTAHSTIPADAGGTAPQLAGGYEIGEEIARGGMGVVRRGRDVALNREVAVKLLQDRFPAGGPAARRFVEEAQITGQLQHPGIPAVHHVGTLPNGRPFLAMKLIKGRTLDDLLKARGPESPNFLAVFEQIAQAVGYAHAHGVIHRDLKPANVMVGAFGEVQVMDWGLAKVLAFGRGPQPGEDPDATLGTEIQSLRDLDDATHAGSVLGTPAFMPPEQAIGAIDEIDARSDVFGLGAILCVILTGRPPYVGANAESTRQLAARAKLDEAFAALDSAAAEPELVSLCKRCLSAEKADRPADGNLVAADVAKLRAAADDRARRAEVERERAAVRIAEERKRRRVWYALAAALAVGLAAATWQTVAANAARRDADTRRGEAETARADAVTKKDEADAARRAEAAERGRAEAKQAETTAVLGFVTDRVLAAAQPKGQGGLGKEATILAAINAAEPQVAGSFPNQPLVEAAVRQAIGTTYWYLGESALSAAQYERAWKLRRASLGEDHRDTLTSRYDLASAWFQLPDRQAEAVRLEEDTLRRRESNLGPADPDTEASRSNLVAYYGRTGREADSFALSDRTYRAMVTALGPDDRRTLVASAVHAGAVSRRPTPENARFLADLYARAARVLGPSTYETLNILDNYASILRELGRREEADALFERAAAVWAREWPADHPNTVHAQIQLADSRITLGRSDEALALYERTVLRMRPTSDWLTDPLSLRSKWVIALIGAGRWDRAATEGRTLVAAIRATGRADHPLLGEALMSVGRSELELGRWTEAEAFLRECLAVREKTMPDSWLTANARAVLGGALLGQRRYAEAEPLLIAGYDGVKRQEGSLIGVGRNHLFRAGLRLGDLYEATGRPEKAAAIRAALPKEVAPWPRAGR